jgi:hypothetical protein
MIAKMIFGKPIEDSKQLMRMTGSEDFCSVWA